MADVIDICNAALFDVGQAAITSLEREVDGSLAAEACRLYYDRTVRELLSQYNWRFAAQYCYLSLKFNSDKLYEPDGSEAETEEEYKARISLYELTRYRYGHLVPPEMLRLCMLFDGNGHKIQSFSERSKPLYSIERLSDPEVADTKTLVICSDFKFLQALCIVDVDSDSYTPLFEKLLIEGLTLKLSPRFEDNIQKLESRRAAYRQSLFDAKASASHSEQSEFISPDTYRLYRSF